MAFDIDYSVCIILMAVLMAIYVIAAVLKSKGGFMAAYEELAHITETPFIFGSSLMIVEMIAPQLLPTIMRNPINCGAIAMLAGLVIVPVVSLFTPKPDQKMVEETFACYNKETVVKQTTALGK